VVDKKKVWSLAFADDMVIVAKSEREMKEMMRNLEKYVRKKKLEVNVEKTKMMVFNKRKRKKEESEWRWEESKIERVSEFNNDDVREHGRERVDVWSRDLGMEGTGGGGESAREIFEMGARSGQRNTRVYSEGRVQEEEVESESGKKSGKVRRQNGRKGRVQDTV
jgi:hypothetical protein